MKDFRTLPLALFACAAVALIALAVAMGNRTGHANGGGSAVNSNSNQPNSDNSAKAEKLPSTMPPLSVEERHVIKDKGTEAPFTGKYWDKFNPGVYICRNCGQPLYLSSGKFKSDCGWPSFDEEIPGAVKRQTDADGRRTEIVCAHCGAHLGHVFTGEQLTAKDTRHCVNSISISLVQTKAAPEEAIFAGGCFWGVEHYFREVPGVLGVASGYVGGTVAYPSYEQVSSGKTGHAEAVRVIYDPALVTYEKLARVFFETHDPTQLNGQGPDIGTNYRSAIFYLNEEQKKTAEKLIGILKAKGYNVVTQVVPAKPFYLAEDYHQDYLTKHPERHACQVRVPRFEDKK
jgi:peptide methionine sulfoxide reductase msrA/msrB